MTLPEPDLPSRYELDPHDPVLGEGGMGRVLRARDAILGVPVALKIVRPDLGADPRFRKLFDLEVRIAARFTHPHIVPLHDLGELPNGTPFLGLALADAGSFTRLQREESWTEILRLTLELLDALAHLHAREVLHRDLKPENVLLHTGDDGRTHVWLADLGLANAASALARKKGRTEGTPGFMAPEQKLGLPRDFGPWTDLYSVGVMLWEAVTGALPYTPPRSALDASLPALVPRAGLAVPDGLGRVLGNLLAGEPLSRYDLAADLITELCALGPAEIDAEGARAVPLLLSGGPVAPSALSPSSSQSSTGQALPASGAALPRDVPVWNRPYPSEMPERPPVEPGFEARARASLPLFALRTPPLVARESYRAQLWELARQVREDGRSRVAVVIGEAGCGKTRIVESLVRALEEGGHAETITMTYQRPPGKEDGYAGAARALLRPWRESRRTLGDRLHRQLGRATGAATEELDELVGQLVRWCGLLEEGEEPAAAGIGLREVYRQLEARAWRGLAAVVLDDAQWAVEEGDGLAIAEAVLRGAEEGDRKRLLVLVTVRAEAIVDDPALSQQVDALVEGGALRLDVPRLDRAGTVELLRESLTLTPELAEIVADRCEGNPLFARQLLLEWVDQGWLVDGGGLQYGLAPGVDVAAVLPADAEALFRDRVRALAAASGRADAFLDLVHSAALAGLAAPAELLLDHAEELGGAELSAFVRGSGLWVRSGDMLRFDHGLLHQALLEEATARPDADSLHVQLARRWVRHGERTGADVDLEVGRHASAGGAWSLAALHLVQAAERASQRGRARELAEAAHLAVDACDRVGHLHHLAGWARYWQGAALQARGDGHRAADVFVAARRLLDRQGDEEGALRALVGLASAELQQGHVDEAEALYRRAHARARAGGHGRAETSAIHGLAYVEQQKRNFDGAGLLFTRVLARCMRQGDSRGMAEATLGQALVALRAGELEEAERLYADAVEAFEEAEDPLGVVRARTGRAVVFRQRLELERAEELYRETLRTAEELGAMQAGMEAMRGLAELARLGGQQHRAQELYVDLLRWARRHGHFEPAILAHLGLARVALDAGDRRVAFDHASRASRDLDKVPGHWLWAPYRLLVAVMLARHGAEEQTFAWLWSASELGLADTVDQDIAALIEEVCAEAEQRGWSRVLRVAANLGARQWRRLGRQDRARALERLST